MVFVPTKFFEIFSKNLLTSIPHYVIITLVELRNSKKQISECAGIGRQARLRGVCLRRTGSSPVTRTKSSVHNEFKL